MCADRDPARCACDVDDCDNPATESIYIHADRYMIGSQLCRGHSRLYATPTQATHFAPAPAGWTHAND